VAETIDNFLIRIAGRIIKIGAFFGITRWQLIVFWIIAGNEVYMMESNMIFHFCFVVINSVFLFFVAKIHYREDDILSHFSPPTSRVLPLFITLLTSFVFQGSHSLTAFIITAILKISFPIMFWLYFCLNQSPKNPLTLKSIVKSFVNKLTSPASRPVLTPISS